MFVRWSNLTEQADEQRRLPGYRDEAVVRHFDAPEALDTRFYEVRARSVLNRVPARSRMPFSWTINPYRGCSHACVFCFARPTHRYLGFDAGRDFEREIVVKVNAPEVLRRELARPLMEARACGARHEHRPLPVGRGPLSADGGHLGSAARRHDGAGNPCSVLTKSPLLLRDLPLMLQIAERTAISASLSIPTLDERAWRATEPHTPNPRARLEAVAELNRAGIPTGVLIAPLMPGINDSPRQLEPLLQGAIEPAREASGESPYTCAARSRTCSWTGCVLSARSLCAAMRISTEVAPMHRQMNVSALPDWCTDQEPRADLDSCRSHPHSP